MNFKGRAKRLDDVDLPRIGYEIGVGEDEVHAVLDVEARGRGFDARNRPAMLFEPHIFYRRLSAGKRQLAENKGLAYKKWRRNYPKDSYPRLLEAMKIDKAAALESCSWGLGQVMGFNYKLAGYASAQDMVEHFLDDEENHLRAMINFIKNTNLAGHLRDHNWDAFARGYNGPGYKKNKYQIKLKKAYLKWSRIKDTPWKRSEAIVTAKTEPAIYRIDSLFNRLRRGLGGER